MASPTTARPDRADLQPRALADAGAWPDAASGAIAGALREVLARRARATLLLSGGTTPAPVYARLADAPLDWSRVNVGLVDERWVPATDAASNARLVRESLLRGAATGARFVPAAHLDLGLADSVARSNALDLADAVVVLGMGDDGHTASLFPAMRGLSEALDAAANYAEVDAAGCPGAGPWRHRISLTPHGLAQASARLLLLRGEDKRLLFARALAGDDVAELPVRLLFDLPGPRLQTFWCP